MKRIENRPVEVLTCDACGAEEASRLEKCGVCKRELCRQDGGKKHLAYSVEVYRFADSQRAKFSVCTGCYEHQPILNIAALLNTLIYS